MVPLATDPARLTGMSERLRGLLPADAADRLARIIVEAVRA